MRQLRPFYTADELKNIYSEPYDHSKWPEHVTRVQHTIDVITLFAEGKHWHSAADLSCGDGAIIKGLYANGVIDFAVMGDLLPGFHVHPRFVGKMEETVLSLQEEYPPFDLFVFSETIEHLEDPQGMLFHLRDVSRNLVLSTPINETRHHKNWEHYWSWDVQEMSDMLDTAGWTSKEVNVLYGDFYDFQIWTASHE